MDRQALVWRNRSMTEAFHATPLKHHVRRAILRAVGHIPIRSQRPRQTERVLLIRPDYLGDILLATPAITALRDARPNAEIHALVGPWSAPALASYPQVDAVLTIDFPGFSRNAKRNWRSPYEQAIRVARQLRLVGYSSAIILRPDHWWGALLAFLAGIPQRIGYDLDDVTPFLTDAIPFESRHAIHQNMHLVERWTGHIEDNDLHYHFEIEKEDQASVDTNLEARGIRPDEPIFCIHPGSGTWVKQWREDFWATTSDTLIDQLGAHVIFTGLDYELPHVEGIVHQMKHHACIMVGETDVGQLAALYKRARVVLGPDSGPLHLAAAVGTPTVALFGPVDPMEYKPWGPVDRHIILTSNIGCRPCRIPDWNGDNPVYHPCVHDISVGSVLEAARRAANSVST